MSYDRPPSDRPARSGGKGPYKGRKTYGEAAGSREAGRFKRPYAGNDKPSWKSQDKPRFRSGRPAPRREFSPPEPAGAPAYSALAYRWRNNRLQPIAHPQQVALQNLLGIDKQKQTLLQNTRQFVQQQPANHALLTGARGTGKSSLVKAMLHEFSGAGLRLVEVPPHDLMALPDIVAPLRGQRERYLLYVDDFSVQPGDAALTALKTALDGGIEAAPDNVLIYATSNRRHLMPETRKDNDEYHWVDDELHPGESTEEKISLSERFGLWLSFPPFNQDRYLELVKLHLHALNVDAWDDELEKAALRWALARASRSGRVAQQFARDWAGRLQVS